MTGENIETNPIKVIRLHCLSCAYSAKEVALCPCTSCHLWPWRFGKNPYRKKREYTDKEREKLREQLAANKAKNAG